MNSVGPTGPSSPKGAFSRMWSTFKSWPAGWKVVTVCLVALGIYGINQNSTSTQNNPRGGYGSDRRPPGPNNPRNVNGSDPNSQVLAQLWAQHKQLTDWAQRCMAEMNQTAAANAQRAMNGQMPVQAQCTQTMYQVTAKLAEIETEIKQLQGEKGGVCELSGYCAPTPSGNHGPGGDGGLRSVERTSREGTLGECFYVSDEGYKVQKPCSGGDHYWQKRGYRSLERPG
ncbi:MAG TPA: hypothetical protein VI636_21155 [Candidatus Angelobacter sp.]